MKYIKSSILLFVFVVLSFFSTAQVFVKRTSDSTFKFIGEAGIVIGSYTYDQFAPDFYLEGFQFQLKKGIYYRLENENNAFRLSLITSNGKINHIAKQYYEIKDTINLNGHWRNTGIQMGFEHFLYKRNKFCFYTGGDAIYRKHKFNGTGSSMFNEFNFQQKISSFGIGSELFFGIRYIIQDKINISMESAFSILYITEHNSRVYSQANFNGGDITARRFSIEPSPFNRISIGYKF